MDIDTLQLDAEERMEKALVALERDFGKLRTGRATTSLVDNIALRMVRGDGICASRGASSVSLGQRMPTLFMN